MRRPPVQLLLLAAVVLACGESPEVPTGSGQGARELLVAGGLVVTMDADLTVIDEGAVAVAEGRIVEVGGAAEMTRRYPQARLVDAAGRIVLPGLINAHTHVPMTLFRGLADDLELMTWLEEVIFPAEAALVDEEFVRWGTRLACLEMIRGGTTTFVDMYYFEDAIAEETEACGLRAVLGETLIDFPAPDNATWEEAVAYSRRFVERWREHARITPAVAPHAPYTVTAEHLVESHALAVEYGVPMMIHLAESQAEVETIREREGMRPVEYAESLGILDERVLAKHMIWPEAHEIAILAERGVGVAHCPQSNMKIAAGAAPVPEMLAAGIAVALGTDGAASNNDLDLWQEMDTAAKLHKLLRRDPTVLQARQALAMATSLGARALGMGDEIGSLEPGKRADLIVVGLASAHQQPLYDPYSLLVYATKASDVETVIVEGRVVMEERRVATLDEAAIRERVAAYRERIRAELASRGRGAGG